MHKLGRLAFTVGTLALALGPAAADSPAGPPATNPNGNFVDLDVNATPLASSAKKPVGMAVEFHSFTGNRLGNPTASSTNITLAFPKGSKLNTGIVPRCEFNPDPNAFSDCAADSQIGSGTAEGAVNNPDGTTTFIEADLKGYNGSEVEGKPTLIFIATVGGSTVAEVDFTVENVSNGPVLDDYILPGATPSTIGLSQFNLTVPDIVKKSGKGKKRKVSHLVTTPRKCPKSGWKFTQTNTYSFGTLAATSVSPCVKAK